MTTAYTEQAINDVAKRCRRLERQNQALKHALYFAIAAVRRLLIATNPEHKDVEMAQLHLDALKTLVPQGEVKS